MKHIVLDACISPAMVKALTLFREADVYHLHDKFQVGALDEYFIPHVARNGWVLVTRDLEMGRGVGMSGSMSPQAKVLKAYMGNAVFLTQSFGRLRLIEQAWRLFRYWSNIRATVEEMTRGQVYDLHDNGKLILRP